MSIGPARGTLSSSNGKPAKEEREDKSLTPERGVTGAPDFAPVGGPPRQLRSVVACADGKWHLKVWRRSSPNQKKCLPFKCKSWRHAGDCRQAREEADRWRVTQALRRDSTAYGRAALIWGVLTIDRKDYVDEFEAFERLRRAWQSMRQAVERKHGAIFGHVSTVEVHRSGWPHLNVVLVSPGLGAALSEKPKATLRWWRSHARACRLGRVASLEPVKSPEGVAKYIAKISDAQVPLNAPSHFRRLRASQGFLPPLPKNPDWTGELVAEPLPRRPLP